MSVLIFMNWKEKRLLNQLSLLNRQQCLAKFLPINYINYRNGLKELRNVLTIQTNLVIWAAIFSCLTWFVHHGTTGRLRNRSSCKNNKRWRFIIWYHAWQWYVWVRGLHFAPAWQSCRDKTLPWVRGLKNNMISNMIRRQVNVALSSNILSTLYKHFILVLLLLGGGLFTRARLVRATEIFSRPQNEVSI